MLDKDDEVTVAMYEELLILDEILEGRATGSCGARRNITLYGKLLYKIESINPVCDLFDSCSELCPCFHACESNQHITTEVLWAALRDENV